MATSAPVYQTQTVATPEAPDGALVRVMADSRFLGIGYYNSRTDIAVRMLTLFASSAYAPSRPGLDADAVTALAATPLASASRRTFSPGGRSRSTSPSGKPPPMAILSM